MSDSVGKISLDLEIQSDISKQISNVSNMIAGNLKKSLNSSMKSTLENVNSSTKKTMGNITNNINSSMKKSITNIAKTMKSILSNIKVPKMDIPKPTNMSTPKKVDVSTNVSKRGPTINSEVLNSQIANLTATLDNVNARIDQQKEKLTQLKESYNSTFNSARKNKIQEQMLKTESSINKLIGQSDKLGFKLAELDGKLASLGNESVKTGNKLGLFNNLTSKGNNLNKKLGNSIKSSSKNMKSYNSGLGSTIGQMFKWMIILPMIVKGLTAMATGIYNNLMTNEQFSNSLAQIKSNLMIAFTPIYEAILPAINALMSALSVATQYIASFISAIFGKTYEQSKQATQGLIDAKTAMGVYGDSAKAAGEAAKDALGLASFDEINSLNSQSSGDSSGSGGSGASGVPSLVTPALDTSSVDSAMKRLVDNIKSYFSTFNFEPLINSFDRLKTSAEPIINNLGKIIKWFLVEILDPLAHWTISDLLPAFLNLLAGALNFLNPILEVFMSVGKWLWDEFLQPIAAWTGGVIVDILNGLADVLGNIGNWISENKPFVEDLVLIIGSFAVAWGLVTGAMNLWNIAVGIWNSVGVIATAVTTGFGAAMTAINWPLLIVVAAIGAVIAIGVLLYKHWDVVKAKAIEVWNGIKAKFEEFRNWLGNVFATDWSKRFGFIGDILNGFLANVRNIFNSVKQIFSGIISFVSGIFTANWSRAWQGVKDIFGGIMSGLGSVIKGPLNAVISLINGAISGLNKISVDIPSWVPGFGGKTFGINIPKIPMLAKGGLIDSPTLAMIGETHKKEAVVPLEGDAKALNLIADKLMERLGRTNISNSEKDRAIQIILKLGDIEFARALIDSINKLTEMNNGECLINL